MRFVSAFPCFLVLGLLMLTVTIPKPAQGQIYETLYSDNVGRSPSVELVQGSDGSLYGTTQVGGGHNIGVIFKMTPAGALTRLHSFDGASGSYPCAGLVEGGDGNFYGTTSGGGDDNKGTIFKLTPAGALTTLYSLCTASGGKPFAELVKGRDGNFYGTARDGGSSGH